LTSFDAIKLQQHQAKVLVLPVVEQRASEFVTSEQHRNGLDPSPSPQPDQHSHGVSLRQHTLIS